MPTDFGNHGEAPRNSWKSAIGGLVLCILLALGGVWWWNWYSHADEPEQSAQPAATPRASASPAASPAAHTAAASPDPTSLPETPGAGSPTATPVATPQGVQGASDRTAPADDQIPGMPKSKPMPAKAAGSRTDVWWSAFVGASTAVVTFMISAGVLWCFYTVRTKWRQPAWNQTLPERASPVPVRGEEAPDLDGVLQQLQQMINVVSRVSKRLEQTLATLQQASVISTPEFVEHRDQPQESLQPEEPRDEEPAPTPMAPRVDPESALREQYLAISKRCSGDRFGQELQSQLRERGVPANVFPVYRDMSLQAAVFEDQTVPNFSVSFRVEIDGISYLVPRPEKDQSFTDLSGFNTAGASPLDLSVGSLSTIVPALLERGDQGAWRVSRPGTLRCSV